MMRQSNDHTAQRVVVAMSGGVDSSVAAALLVEQGYDVVGLMLRLWAEPGGAANRCCTPNAVADARRVADVLGIPFYVRDYKDVFKSTVVDFFIEGYSQGVTPNPCVVCNRDIRFERLLNEALALGGNYLATGHYARVQHSEAGGYQLLRGIDPAKDQSYMLYTMTQDRLAHVKLPVGEYSKSDIRQIAKDNALPVFDRPDSQDLCFLGAGDYRSFLHRHAPEVLRAGAILNSQGEVLGQHYGLALYTIGQRKGLGISAPHPMYVIDKDMETNTLLVGPKSELGQRELKANRVSYIDGQVPVAPLQVEGKIRYKSEAMEATLIPLAPDEIQLDFETDLYGITPGQAIVFYQGDRVLGGGTITS